MMSEPELILSRLTLIVAAESSSLRPPTRPRKPIMQRWGSTPAR